MTYFKTEKYATNEVNMRIVATNMAPYYVYHKVKINLSSPHEFIMETIKFCRPADEYMITEVLR